MHLVHAGAEDYRLYAVGVHDVRVAAAAGGADDGLQAESFAGFHYGNDERLVVGLGVAGVAGGRLAVELRAEVAAGLFQAFHHVLRLRFELRVVAASHFGLNADAGADDVRRADGLEGADVGRRLLVDAQQLHRGDGGSPDLYRADALFGGEPRVRRNALYLGTDLRLPRRGGDYLARVAAGVKDDRLFRGEFGVVEGLGADHADLFADGEDHLDGAVGDPLLACRRDRLDDRRDSGFVVSAEYGAAVGVYHAVGDDGADTFARRNGVDVGAHEKRRRFSREYRYDAACLFYADAAAKRFKVGRGAAGHRRLVSAFAVDREVFKKVF